MGLFRKKANSLRVRFALGFGILFTFFLALALVLIYFSFASYRKEESHKILKDRAYTTFKLLIEVDQINNGLLQTIDSNTLNSISNVKVLVFKDTSLMYSNLDDRKIEYGPSLFAQAKQKGELYTSQGENEIAALYFHRKSGNYTILSTFRDKYGRRKMAFLKWVMIAVYCLGLIIGWLATYFFVKRMIRPLESLKKNLKKISYNNLGTRFPEKGQGEEVDSLSADFNQMLIRLEKSFNYQRDFMHYASHELRTPLAAMVSLTENSINTAKNTEEMIDILRKLYQQQKNLTDITNSLLLLSGNKDDLDTEKYPKVRLDEMIFKSVDIIKSIFPDAQIDVNLEGEFSNETTLLIHSNEPLILMAFNNLLKNALQYSEGRKVSIIIKVSETEKEVQFLNAGNSFGSHEKEKIFTPFYRASNAASVKGHGLGLPLVKQIMQLHKATINYSYEKNMNIFKVVFLS
jgi:two-component system sensor histidine kinase ArlS